MSKIKSKLSTNRRDLSKILPLKTPYVVQIDPSSRCNFKCKFCPAGRTDKENDMRTIMKLDLFKKIIDGLSCFDDKIKTIKLWKDGEPLLNCNISEMIKYAKGKRVSEKIELTTNGYLLNEQLNYKLIESGLDKIVISIEGLNEEDYSKNSGVEIDFNKLVKNIKDLYCNKKQCTIHIKIIDIDLSENYKKKFFQMFNDISDEMFIEKAIPCWPDFEDDSITHKLLNVWGKSVESKEVCTLPLYSLVVNANGKVSMCCNDWQQKIIVGDANKETMKEIWNKGEVIKFHILQLSKKRKSIPICSRCMYPDYVAVDNIDDSSLYILDKYKNICNRSNLK